MDGAYSWGSVCASDHLKSMGIVGAIARLLGEKKLSEYKQLTGMTCQLPIEFASGKPVGKVA